MFFFLAIYYYIGYIYMNDVQKLFTHAVRERAATESASGTQTPAVFQRMSRVLMHKFAEGQSGGWRR
jgi:hypothetical protein